MLFGACRSDDEQTPDVVKHRNVVFISSLGGPGDNGYNDLLMEAEVAFMTEHPEIEAHFLQPKSLEGAKMIVNAFTYIEKCDSLLFVLNGSEYAGVIQAPQDLDSITKKGGPSDIHVLQFEGRADELPTTTSFNVQRYGASYIAGRLASGVPVLVLAALKGDEQVDAAVQGFLDGYSVESTYTPHVHYLSDDVRGFDMPNAAMQVCDSVVRQVFPDIDFYGKVIPFQYPGFCIFPVAGGSNMGAYRYVSALSPELMINAIGMDKDYLPKVFEPFSQESENKANKYGSTGLGMAITKNLVEMMNGTISVESEKGVGTTFTVTVTLRTSDKKTHESLEMRPQDLRVLIIDDLNKRLQEFRQEAIVKEKAYEEKLKIRN